MKVLRFLPLLLLVCLTSAVANAEYDGNFLHVHVVNAACPGETTSSFLSSAGVHNGCRAFRSAFPLHVPYSSTQLNFAISFLKSDRNTRLVTIGLGANDGFVLEEYCATQSAPESCITNGLPGVLATVAQNMQTILSDLRMTGYRGPIIG